LVGENFAIIIGNLLIMVEFPFIFSGFAGSHPLPASIQATMLLNSL